MPEDPLTRSVNASATRRHEFHQVLRSHLEPLTLLIEHRTVRRVRRRKVCENAFEAEVLAGKDRRQCAWKFIVSQSQPMHAGVDLQVISDRSSPFGRCRLQDLGGLWRRDRWCERMLDQGIGGIGVVCVKHENWRSNAGLTQCDAFVNVSTRKHCCSRLLESERDAAGTVTVAVGLDDGDDRGRHSAGLAHQMLLDRSEVLLQRVQVDTRRGVSCQ